MDIDQFRLEFPEFADPAKYPDAQLEFWACIAQKQVVACVWQDMTCFGIKLYVAHEITLAYQNAKASASGGVPGLSGGIANSKTVGSASIGYDTTVSSEKDAGWWNLTNYGKQFIHLARLFGAGCIQL